MLSWLDEEAEAAGDVVEDTRRSVAVLFWLGEEAAGKVLEDD